MPERAQILRVLLVSASMVLLAACSTSRHRLFDRINIGMEKDQVLEAAGSPNRSSRVRGNDRWVYIYRDHPDGTKFKEVEFQNGKVVYAGDKKPPAISAAEQDKINEEENALESERMSADKKEWENQMGAARAQRAAGPSKKLDEVDRKIRDAYSGTTDSLEEEKRKRAPVFEPVN